MKEVKIFFSIIIPTFNRNEMLAKCLDSLSPGTQTIDADKYEVIVTDDGIDNTAEDMINENYPWVRWFEGPHKGPAANRNNGAKYAKGEWLVFTDDDCLPDSQWLSAYNEGIKQHKDCKVFEGRTYFDRPKRSLAEIAPANETGGYLWSCNFAIKRRLFEEFEGFDTRFTYSAMEDVDLHKRLLKNNIKIYFLEQASLCHPWRSIGSTEIFQQHLESTFTFLSLHPEELTNFSMFYFLKINIKNFITETIPELFKFRAKGWKIKLAWHLYNFKKAFLIFYIYNLKKRNNYNNT